jgi:hypothetical protein
VLYLPQHLQFIISRAWFYMHGDAFDTSAAAKGAIGQMLSSVVGTVGSAAQVTAESVKEL